MVYLREMLGYKQPGFAELIGCSLSTLQAVERGPGRLKISAELAEKIFLATGIAPDWLLSNNVSASGADMIEGMEGKPYTKAVFDKIQASRSTSGDRESFNDRHNLVRALKGVLGSFLAAEKTSMQSAALVRYRVGCLADQLRADFGWDNFSYLKEGQAPRDAVVKAIYNFFEAANFKPVPMADGTMQEIRFAEQSQG